jgi:hypothetical protein
MTAAGHEDRFKRPVGLALAQQPFNGGFWGHLEPSALPDPSGCLAPIPDLLDTSQFNETDRRLATLTAATEP